MGRSLRQKTSLIVKMTIIHWFFDKNVDNCVSTRDKRHLLKVLFNVFLLKIKGEMENRGLHEKQFHVKHYIL